MKIAIINGPNLNLLGTRETDIYGGLSLNVILEKVAAHFPEVEFSFFQSNIEGELIDAIQKYGMDCDGVVLNPAGYSHTSVAIADAVAAVTAKVVEVHISNIFNREKFREHSFVSAKAVGVISGLGVKGYQLAVEYLLDSSL